MIPLLTAACLFWPSLNVLVRMQPTGFTVDETASVRMQNGELPTSNAYLMAVLS